MPIYHNVEHLESWFWFHSEAFYKPYKLVSKKISPKINQKKNYHRLYIFYFSSNSCQRCLMMYGNSHLGNLKLCNFNCDGIISFNFADFRMDMPHTVRVPITKFTGKLVYSSLNFILSDNFFLVHFRIPIYVKSFKMTPEPALWVLYFLRYGRFNSRGIAN